MSGPVRPQPQIARPPCLETPCLTLSFHCSQAGVYTLNDGFSLFEILENPKKLSRQLAEEKPAWEPGECDTVQRFSKFHAMRVPFVRS